MLRNTASDQNSFYKLQNIFGHCNDVIMGTMTSQITSLTIVYSTVYSDADQWKHQSTASLALVRVIHRGPVNSPHKWPVTRKMFPFDDVIMVPKYINCGIYHFNPCVRINLIYIFKLSYLNLNNCIRRAKVSIWYDTLIAVIVVNFFTRGCH